jgi:aspartyl-tRNA(Asn)/glutamyl-tRNA(Gln) amidotransferase subunit B
VTDVRSSLPELPAHRRARYVTDGLDESQAAVLSDASAGLRELYESTKRSGADPVQAANWVTGELTGWLRRTEGEGVAVPLTGGQLAELLTMVEDGTVSSSAAKDVLEGVIAGEGEPREVAVVRDLIQISDTRALEDAVASVIEANPDAVESFRSGETKVVGFLVGQVMRSTQGRADPKQVNDIIRAMLSS